MNIVLVILIAYVLGSIPSALWIGKVFFKTDIREHGSGNLGATNTFRVLGKKAGIIVTLLDILKGSAAVWIASLSYFQPLPVETIVIGLFAVIGHMFPLFARFRGGKAVATSAGVLLAYAPIVFLIVLAIFIICLKITKMVSLSSVIVACSGIIIAIVEFIRSQNYSFSIIVICMALFIIYRHRANLERIKNGTEPKITWI